MSPGRVITFLWKLKGEALAAMGNTKGACSLLRDAIESAHTTGERFLLWSLHVSLGRLYRTLGQRSAGGEEFSTARELAEELAATLPDGGLRDNFLRQAQNTLNSSP
jgi:hypothetical protein